MRVLYLNAMFKRISQEHNRITYILNSFKMLTRKAIAHINTQHSSLNN